MLKIDWAPTGPGCYIFRDKLENVIYVGKSKNLLKRVRQYFQRTYEIDDKLYRLTREAVSVEYVETDSELDALMTEYRLIKSYRPWFNSQLKRDKRYVYIKLNVNRDTGYPSLEITRELESDAKYIGAFRDAEDAQNALDTLSAVWKTPTCGKSSFANDSRACLEYHLGKCLAPCSGIADPAVYSKAIREIFSYFRGKDTAAVKRLRRAMRDYARDMEFEKAGALKDVLDSLERLRYRIERTVSISEDKDVAVLIRPYHSAEFSIFVIQGGVAVTRENFNTKRDNIRKGCADSSNPEKLEISPEDGKWIASCLAEIYADKLIVELPKAEDKRNVAIANAIERFSTPDPESKTNTNPQSKT